MELVLWFTGVLIVIALLKFELRVFKNITSKDSMDEGISKMNQKIKNGADKVSQKYKERKAAKQEQPIVTIR